MASSTMGDEVAISVKRVSKSFKLPHEQHNGIKQALLSTLRGGNKNSGYEVQHALKDISFDIKKGDFFGIVGRNGSGKSTLLKLISEIYTPDSGHIQVNGKLTPFIELGVGFNPELTGRENVFLNGALLGFSRKEIETMYDDIVEFAELGKFMDQKLKNYSSGMQVRLAFSVAIKAESDILLLDEVLAVGDEAFQKKCFNYFEELREKKKTVILVTHDMGSVKQFCTKAILIENGSIKSEGSPDDVANQYTLDNLSAHNTNEDQAVGNKKGMRVSGNVKSIRIKPKSALVVSRSDVLEFDVELECSGDVSDLYLGISLSYKNVSIVEDATTGIKISGQNNKVAYRYRLPLDRFTQGDFTVSAAILTLEERELIAFTTEEGNFNFAIINKSSPVGGVFLERGEWV